MADWFYSIFGNNTLLLAAFGLLLLFLFIIIIGTVMKLGLHGVSLILEFFLPFKID